MGGRDRISMVSIDCTGGRLGRTRGSLAALVASTVAAGLLIVGAPGAVAATCDGVQVACAIGDTGPGGGLVIYDAGSPQVWGRYLEVAPAGWSGSAEDPKAPWCAKGKRGYGRRLPVKTTIGSGAINTRIIIRACGRNSAAGLAGAYRGGGFKNWFLPSDDEIRAVLDARDSSVDALPLNVSFWSSSQESATWPFGSATCQGDGDACQNSFDGNGNRVRPVRAF